MVLGGFILFDWLSSSTNFSWSFYAGQTVLVAVTYLVDFWVPAAGVRQFHGSSWAVKGALLGSLLVFIAGPIGLLIGPILGAIIGELAAGQEVKQALKAGIGGLWGLLGSTLIKLAILIAMLIWFYLSL